MAMSLLLVILTPFLGAALAAEVSRWGRLHAAWMAGAVTLIALAWLLPLASTPFAGQAVVQRFSWMPAAGLDLAFRLDGLGLLFALLILLIGLLIILYARYYLSPNDSMGRFYASLLLFMGSMLGVALSENIIQLLIFWELTSLSSFLLISYWQQRTEARNGARMALNVTGAGGLALLGGFLLLGEIAGSYDLSVILVSGDVIRAHPLYLPMLLLVLLGAFTKSAQFPFHFWLPSAMAAPTPVSAYLHSATMVKAGVFLLARLFPALSGTPEWAMLVGGVGLTTLLIGAFIALFQHDLKGLLAYSTISHLGLITLLFGIGTPLAAIAGVFHIINHATFKASLFMAAGIIDHETGSRDMRRINGLWKFMPHTAVLAMVASAAMAGVPLLNGFLSKEMFFAEAVGVTTQMRFGWLLPAAVTVAGIFAVAYSLRFIHDVFFNGEPINLPKTPHEPTRWMKVPVEILVALCLLVGIFPALTVEPILAVASVGVLQGPLPGRPDLPRSPAAVRFLRTPRTPTGGESTVSAPAEQTVCPGRGHHATAGYRLVAADFVRVHPRRPDAGIGGFPWRLHAIDRDPSPDAGGWRQSAGDAGSDRRRDWRGPAAPATPDRAYFHGRSRTGCSLDFHQILRPGPGADSTLGRGGHYRAVAAGPVFPAAAESG